MTTSARVDRNELEAKVKEVYRGVALEPHGDFRFEIGRALVERLGYPAPDLERIPGAAIDSFAGVGYHLGLASLTEGESVLDLGSGSGMDTFLAALKVGPAGTVVGVDMTDEQRAKAEGLRVASGFDNVRYLKGYIEQLPLDNVCFDAVISNGVINLAADKDAVFREAARVLKRGGRFALSDIVTEAPLPDSTAGNASLWAVCIGGAMQEDDYLATLGNAGFEIGRAHV